MKRFKIVAHYVAPEEFIYRLYERELFFFWRYIAAFHKIEQVNSAIEDIYAKEDKNDQIPPDEVVGYV
ncbi:hypothetical protein MT_57038 [Pseudomonas phage phiPto-bp6g]|nr:hypothetical protein MT_57038 [Pseudomonas phage phiPto-bp6g]